MKGLIYFLYEVFLPIKVSAWVFYGAEMLYLINRNEIP